MTTHDITIAKIRQLPEPLVQEVNTFVDYLLLRQDASQWAMWQQFVKNANPQRSSRQDPHKEIKPAENDSFLAVAQNLQLEGPADWSARFDHYLYGLDHADE